MRFVLLVVAAMLVGRPAAAQPAPPPPPAGPYSYYPDPCMYSNECGMKGRCRSHEGRCVAGGDFDCAQSQICRSDGDCFYDARAQHCDDGTERASTPMFVGGLVVVGVGAATTVAGVVTMVMGMFSGLGCSEGRPCGAERTMMAGVVMMPLGAGLALLVGLPLAVVGGERVSRHSVGPGVGGQGPLLRVTF